MVISYNQFTKVVMQFRTYIGQNHYIENFTPFSAIAGGTLIGLGTALLLLLNGRIAGISGILSRLWSANKEEKAWRAVFIIGLVAGCFFTFTTGTTSPKAPNASTLLIIIGGILVGAGTVLGSGCTSGHGVCGIGQLSRRSIIATCIFMFTAMVTVFVVGAIE